MTSDPALRTRLDDLQARVQRRQKIAEQVKTMIVERLDLPVDPQWITSDQPLFGRGLELDSVDALELVVGIESDFAVAITDDQVGVFGSINRLIDYIEEQQ
jgi:acyl carrier protein